MIDLEENERIDISRCDQHTDSGEFGVSDVVGLGKMSRDEVQKLVEREKTIKLFKGEHI